MTGAPRARDRLVDAILLVCALALALALALAVTSIIVLVSGKSVPLALRTLWDGGFGSRFAISNTLNKAAPILLVAVGFLVSRRAGLMSVGGEGQIFMGGLGAIAIALATSALPRPLPMVLAVVAAFALGGLWGALAGFFRARFAVNEVIATLLLNFIAYNVVGIMVQTPWLLREKITSTTSLPQSPRIDPSARLPLLTTDRGMRVHIGIVLAVFAALVVRWVLRHSTLGFRIRVVGANDRMAARVGIGAGTIIVIAMAISGGLAGVGGAVVVLGEQYRLQERFSPGYGFDGIAVALLARSSPLGAIAGAVLFGALRAGGALVEARMQLPQAVVLMIQGVIVLSFAGATYVFRPDSDLAARVRRSLQHRDATSVASPLPEAVS